MMRIQMIKSVHQELTGSRLTFNGGEFYIVDDAYAAELIAAGDAIDPENPPAPVVEEIQESEQAPEIVEIQIDEQVEVTD